jgi:hypothetical protein
MGLILVGIILAMSRRIRAVFGSRVTVKQEGGEL